MPPTAKATRDVRPKPPAETRRIMERLFGQHPNAFTELDFRTPFELLVATILSAQSTDRGVNQVTPGLFEKYPTPAALAAADVPELERILKPTGFFRQKAKAVMGMAAALVRDYGGEVPADMDALTTLPGVGRKTANVVLGHALGVPGMPVDRHVLRVSNRIGIAHAATPEEVETQLCAAMPREQWTLTSDTLILHGRRICRPHPLCDQCTIVSMCDFALEWNRTGSAEATKGSVAKPAVRKISPSPSRKAVAAPKLKARATPQRAAVATKSTRATSRTTRRPTKTR
jgi:endonuclease-3